MIDAVTFLRKRHQDVLPQARPIETLFKRNYIRKSVKPIATPTVVELIKIIQKENCSNRQNWTLGEKTRQIEKGEYQAVDFLNELKRWWQKLFSTWKAITAPKPKAQCSIHPTRKLTTLWNHVCPRNVVRQIITKTKTPGCSSGKTDALSGKFVTAPNP